MPPFSRKTAIAIIEDEFGTKIDNVFLQFSEPVAAASIAQVHFAKIKSSNTEIDVAVKVLRPEIEKTINQEMERLEWLTTFMENFAEFQKKFSNIFRVLDSKKPSKIDLTKKKIKTNSSEPYDAKKYIIPTTPK